MKIQEKAQDEINLKNSLEPLIIKYSDLIFPELTDIFNIIFAHGNDTFELFTVQFVEENFSIRIIKQIVDIVIEQNKIEGILPFLKESFQVEFLKALNLKQKMTIVN